MPRTLLLLALLSAGCSDAPSTDQSATAPASDTTATRDTLIHPDERHFKTLKQLTFGGDNAEAYWSFSGDKLVFQSNNPGWGESCDQIYVFNPFTDDLRNTPPPNVSINGGRTTCSLYLCGARAWGP